MRRLILLSCLLALALPATASAATSFQLGTGEHPDVYVDTAGTAHVVWDESSGSSTTPDPLHYCQVPRGATACTKSQVLHPPLEAIGRASYVFVPSPNHVVIVTYRCCGTGEGNWAYQSNDNGTTFDGGTLIGNIDFEQGAVWGPGNAITGATTSTVQTMPLTGPPPSSRATLNTGFGTPTSDAVALFNGTTLVYGAAEVSQSSFNRQTGPDPNNSSDWSGPTQLGAADDIRAAGGPAGLVLTSTVRTSGGAQTQIAARKFDGTNFGAPVPISEAGNPIFPDLSAEQVGGHFYEVWVANGSQDQLRYATSADGVSWRAQTLINTPDIQDSVFNPQISAAPDGQGLVVWDDNASNSPIKATTLTPAGGTGTAPNTPVASVTIGGTEVDFFAPSGCVKAGSKITERVTSKQKRKLSPKQRVKIKQVVFFLDKKKHTDKKAAFKATFPTRGTGFAKGSRHKTEADLQLRPVRGHGKVKKAKLRAKFTICSA